MDMHKNNINHIVNSFFQRVPEHQSRLFRNFIESNPKKSIEAAGKVFQYTSCGIGTQTVVLLSGAMVSSYMWFHVAQLLQKEYRLLIPELPKTGMGADEAIILINSILKLEKIDKAIIAGYSYGGAIAQYFAALHPEKVDCLVLSHTGLIWDDDKVQKIEKALRIIKWIPGFMFKLAKYIRTKGCKASEWYLFRKAFFNWSFSTIVKKDIIQMLENSKVFQQNIEQSKVEPYQWKGNTVIMGTKSDRDTFKYFDELCKHYKNCSSYVFDLPEAGHHTIFLYPKEYTQKFKELIVSKYTKSK
ncbi:alpha/beta hydrolase [Candidatus Uabimicrobium amorphum]|uniref:Hydrolase n=1 Tax=Uabimicrobium amorphum TaxID=2596890 RepID=A0A5S9F692_UABAM|nr:alpha/beta hydrolase [Candidatus Uabimicrobium amorphum]BBM87151.1 hydrolase [Candidatus Uabimicrobium amorphum]